MDLEKDQELIFGGDYKNCGEQKILKGESNRLQLKENKRNKG